MLCFFSTRLGTGRVQTKGFEGGFIVSSPYLSLSAYSIRAAKFLELTHLITKAFPLAPSALFGSERSTSQLSTLPSGSASSNLANLMAAPSLPRAASIATLTTPPAPGASRLLNASPRRDKPTKLPACVFTRSNALYSSLFSAGTSEGAFIVVAGVMDEALRRWRRDWRCEMRVRRL